MPGGFRVTAPTWQELSDAGWAITDDQNRQLAIYPDELGQVVVALHDGDGQLHCVALTLHDVAPLGLAVKRACEIAAPIVAERGVRAAQATAQDVIDRMRGAA